MAQSIRISTSTDFAGMVLDDIQFQRSQYYYFLGGVEPWNGFGGSVAGDLVGPDDIFHTDEINRAFRSEIAYVKKISPNEVSLSARRIDWNANRVYDQWDHTREMSLLDFYVLTNEFKVYKCLDNNNESPSTVQPTTTSIFPARSADGYLWKYMYTIPPFKRSMFTTTSYMPIQRALSDNFYNNGAVDAAVVELEGSGYTDQLLTQIVVSENTVTGSGAEGTLVLDGGVPGVGAITGVTLINGGSGYYGGVRIEVDPGTSSGSGAVIEAVIVNGVITVFNVLESGYGYGVDSTINFVLGQASLVPIVSRLSGSIVGVKVLDPGVGYATAPTLTVFDSLGAGEGKYGNPSALLTAVVYEGSIRHVNTIDPGLNYSFDGATSISVQGIGVNAVFTPIIVDGRVVDVLVENPGTGYMDIQLTVNSPTGTGAKVKGIITQSDYISDQMVVEQTAVQGAIYNIKVTDEGANYTSSAAIEVLGDGQGCTASLVISNGKITRINVLTPGQGYTYSEVIITDVGRFIVPAEDVATAYAILPSIGGHGYDSTLELYADSVVINTPLRGELEVEGIVQEYRNFGIIKNPRNLLTGSRYKLPSSLAVYKMRFSSAVGISSDEILKYGETKYRVLQIEGDIVSLIPLDNDTIVPLGVLDSTLPSGGQYQSVETIQSLDFDKYSGTLMYLSTENPFSFTEDQSITIKTFIKF